MIAFKVTDGDGDETIVNDSESIFDLILRITGDQAEAIEVSCWAEKATIYEVYNNKGFCVEIIEE